MTIDIYRDTGFLISIEIDEKTVFSKKLQGDQKITTEFIHKGASGLDVTIGDYISYPASGEHYTINRLPSVVKINDSTFKYNITFEATRYNMAKKLLVSSDEVTDFAYNGSPSDHLTRILANINVIDPTWTADASNSSGSDKTIQYINESCLSALSKVSDAYDMEFDINDRVISLQDSISGASGYSFKYGQASGLYKLERQQVSNQNIITRCYGYGGTKNIPATYRAPSGGTKRLIFESGGAGYLQDSAATGYYGVIEAQYTDDTIYPQRTGTLTGVVFAASGTGAWDDDTDYVVDSTMDFNINSYRIEGQTATIVFKSGDLNGIECEIWQYTDATKRFYITPFKDTDGAIRPNSVNYPAVGDSYTIVNISMPDSYVTTAETTLQTATQAYLDKNKTPQVVYSIDIDPKYAKSNTIDLSVGDKVTIIDTDLSINSLIRISAIEFPLVNTYKIKATISDFVPYTLNERIVKNTISNIRDTTIVDKDNKELTRRVKISQATIEGDLSLYAKLASPLFTGNVGINSIGVSALHIDGTNPIFTFECDPTGIARINFGATAGKGIGDGFIFYSDNTGGIYLGTNSTNRIALLTGGNFGVGVMDPDEMVEVQNGTGIAKIKASNTAEGYVKLGITGNATSTATLEFTNSLSVTGGSVFFGGIIQEPNFVDGWTVNGGKNWHITTAGDATLENLLVRGAARFRELIIDQLSVIGGSTLQSVARGKIASVDTVNSKVTIEDPYNNGVSSFADDDFFWSKNIDIDGGLFSDNRGQITAATGLELTLDFSASGANGAIADFSVGDVIVQRGHPTTVARQNLIYTTVADTGNPFSKVMTGVDSLNAFGDLDNTVLQYGNLDILASHDIVPADPGIGLYSKNVYLSGLIQAASGYIGGWTINSTYLAKDTGTDATSAGMSPTDYPFYAGATYANMGTAPFRINNKGHARIEALILFYSVSDTPIISHDAEASTNSLTYVKVKTITLGDYVEGNKTLRIKFDLKSSTAGRTASGKILMNGNYAGTVRFNSTTSYITYSEDISAWNAGDAIELWIHIDDIAALAYASNLRVCGTFTAGTVNEVTGTIS